MQSDIIAFDLKRILIGEAPPWFLLEIVSRTVFLYAAAILLLRLMGKRGMSDLSPFEQAIIIALGSAVGDPMFYPSVPLLYGVVVMVTVVVLHALLAKGVERSDGFKHFVEGEPALLIDEGEVLSKELEAADLSKEDLYSRLRLQGIENVRAVKRAYLEVSGKMSVFTYPQREVKGFESTFPES